MSSLQNDFLSSRVERSNTFTFTDANMFGSPSSDSPLSSVKEYNFLADTHPQNRRPSIASPILSPITPHSSEQLYSTLSSCDLMQDYDNMKTIETGIEEVLLSVERYIQAFRELRKASKDIDMEMSKFYGREGKLGPIASKLHELKDPLHDDEVYQELELLAEAQQIARRDYGHVLGSFKHRLDERDALMAKYTEMRAKQRKKKKTPASSNSTTPANSQPGTLKDDLFHMRSSIADLNIALVEDIAIFNEQRQDLMDRCFIQMLTFKSKLHSFFPVDSDIDSLIKDSKKLSSTLFNDESISDLKQLLSSPLLIYYRNFLTSEHSEENLDFYLETLSYKSLSIQQEINEHASFIYNTYLKSGAPRQVNIAHNTQQLLDMRMNKGPDYDLNVFEKASKEIFKLMESDSWKRFIKSDFFPRMHYRATKKEWNVSGEETEFKTGGVFPKLSEKKPKTREEYLKIRNKESKNGTLKKGLLSSITNKLTEEENNNTLRSRKYTLDDSSSSNHSEEEAKPPQQQETIRKKLKKKIELSDLEKSFIEPPEFISIPEIMIPTNLTSPEPRSNNLSRGNSKEISKSRSLSSEHIVGPKYRMRSFSDPENERVNSPPKLTRKSSIARVKIEKEYDSKYSVLRKLNLGKKKEDTVVYLNPLLKQNNNSVVPTVNVTSATTNPKKKERKFSGVLKKTSPYPRSSATYFANPLHEIVQDREELKSQIYNKQEKKTKSNSASTSSFYDGNQSLTDYSLVYPKSSMQDSWIDNSNDKKDLPDDLKEEQRKIMEENAKRLQEREMRRKKREEELAKEMEDGLKEVERRRRENEEKKKQLEKEAKEALEEAEKRKEERRKRLESIN